MFLLKSANISKECFISGALWQNASGLFDDLVLELILGSWLVIFKFIKIDQKLIKNVSANLACMTRTFMSRSFFAKSLIKTFAWMKFVFVLWSKNWNDIKLITAVWFSKVFNIFQLNLVFHIDQSHLICTTN